jgi:Site-specific recombinases, DNA invertase Pin homologs
MNQVYCLYRVSTNQQLHEDDIPMQRQACRTFADERGWTIVKEFYEKGISGFKTPTQNRKVLQQIKKDAELGKFDILLVFMFDRLGRRDSETPFFVEDLAMHGIKIWSVKEGQQRFESHADKLINYIRYWQASGESQKTSERIKTRMSQLTEEGQFCGGRCPYGYQLIKTGRKNNRGYEIHDLAVQPDEAVVVRKIFDYYIRYGYGGRQIASALAEEGIRNRDGEKFHYSSIRNMLQKEQYTGVFIRGDSRSELIPDLQIITSEIFCTVQQNIQLRKNGQLPRKVTGGALLSGNIYCAHCGGRMFATTTRKSHHTSDKHVERVAIYKCYNRTQYKGHCPGKTSYRAQMIDEQVEKELQQYFELNKKMPQICRLAKEWEQSELPVQKMIAGQLIERVEVSSCTDPKIVFRELC